MGLCEVEIAETLERETCPWTGKHTRLYRGRLQTWEEGAATRISEVQKRLLVLG